MPRHPPREQLPRADQPPRNGPFRPAENRGGLRDGLAGIEELTTNLQVSVDNLNSITGKIATFAPDAKIIHVDIDPAEQGKVRRPDVPIVGDCRLVTEELIKAIRDLKESGVAQPDQSAWRSRISGWQEQFPLYYEPSEPGAALKPQLCLEKLRDAAPEGTPIHIGARVDGGNVVAWVEDSGPGLPEGDTAGIFERFKRGGAQEPEPGGLGLGLWISRSIVERHGGSIAAERTAEGFTRFTLTLPREPQS